MIILVYVGIFPLGKVYTSLPLMFKNWIGKAIAYTMEFYTAERKKELLPFATTWMELESILLSEISQAVRDKYHIISPLTGT